jgi:hypothetical protein
MSNSEGEQVTFRLNTKSLEITIVVLTAIFIPLLVWSLNIASTTRENELKIKSLEEDLKVLKEKVQKGETESAVNKQSIVGLDKQLDGISKTLASILDKM